MPHVVFGCVVILCHRFVCDTTRPHANLTIYTFWRCKNALLHLSEQNVYISIHQYINRVCFRYKTKGLLNCGMAITINTHQKCSECI